MRVSQRRDAREVDVVEQPSGRAFALDNHVHVARVHVTIAAKTTASAERS